MKKIILVIFSLIAIIGVKPILAQSESEGITVVYIEGPAVCPDDGWITGERDDGNALPLHYYGQTNGGGGPSSYHLAWYCNFYNVMDATCRVETSDGFGDVFGYGFSVPFDCYGEKTKPIGYGQSLNFHLDMYLREQGQSGNPPGNDD